MKQHRWTLWIRILSAAMAILMAVIFLPLSAYAEEFSAREEETNTAALPQEDTELAAKAEPEEAATVLYELTGQRDENTKTFRMSDGTQVLTVYPEAVHYAADGAWEPIDNTLYLSDGVYQNTASAVAYSFSAQQALPQISAEYEGYSLRFCALPSAADAEITPAQPGEELQETKGTEEGEKADALPPEASSAEAALDTAAPEESAAEPQPASAAQAESADTKAEQSQTEAAAGDTAPDVSDPDAAQQSPEAAPESDAEKTTLSAEEQREQALLSERLSVPCEIAVQNPSLSFSEEALQGMSAQDAAKVALQSASMEYIAQSGALEYRYTLHGNTLKESIVLPAFSERQSYAFSLFAKGLRAVLSEEGAIGFFNEAEEKLFEIPAPYLLDAAGQRSDAASYTLEQTEEDAYILTVHIDTAWLAMEERAYPGVIDPTLYLTATAASASQIETQTCKFASGTVTEDNTGMIDVGYQEGSEYISRVKFSSLPALPRGAKLVSSRLILQPVSRYSRSGENSMYLCVEQAKTGWEHSSFHGGTTLDYAKIDVPCQSNVSLDVTVAVKNFLNDKDSNNGFMLYGMQEPGGASFTNTEYACQSFGGSADSWYAPVLQLSFRSTLGLEDYYTYYSEEVGRAGTMHINEYSGALTVVRPLAESSDYSLCYVYCTDTPPEEKMFGATANWPGWKLNAQECITEENSYLDDNGKVIPYFLYSDADGTAHYFAEYENGIYRDEDGLGLFLASDGAGNYLMQDLQGNTKLFCGGILTKITDTNSNVTAFCYNGNSYASGSGAWYPSGKEPKLTSVVQHNNGKTPYTIATLGYDGDRLYTVTDRNGFERVLVHESGTDQHVIVDPDGNGSRYRYNAENELWFLYDTDSGLGRELTYEAQKPKDLYTFFTYLSTLSDRSTRQAHVIFNFSNLYKTEISDCGKDLASGTADDTKQTLLFDNYGRTVSVSLTDANGILLGASGASYQKNSGTSRKNNRLLTAGTSGMVGQNLLREGGMEKSGAWNGGSISTAAHRSGYSSLYLCGNASGTVQATQSYTVKEGYGGDFTLSAYVKTENLSDAQSGGITVAMTVGGETVRSVPLRRDTALALQNGWTRLQCTVSAPAGASIVAQLCVDKTAADVYFDDVQLERGATASSYNYVFNGNFDYGTEGYSMTVLPMVGETVQHDGTGGKAYLVPSMLDALPLAWQDIPINETVDADHPCTYQFSAWAKASTSALTPQRTFQITARVIYDDGSYENHTVSYHAEIHDEWQFACIPVVPKKSGTIASIKVHCSFYRNTGTGCFDDLALVREPCATYQYDANGQLTKLRQSETATKSYTYSGADLTSASGGTQGDVSYTYDANHNVTSAVRDGLETQYTYDSAGRVVRSEVYPGHGFATKATYTADGSRLASSTDTLYQTVNYTYTHSAASSKVKEELPVSGSQYTTFMTYSSDNQGFLRQTYKNSVVSLENSYCFGRVINVQRRGHTEGSNKNSNSLNLKQNYSFDYDYFGNPTTSKAGSYLLSSNAYSGYRTLASSTYGNGAVVGYEYDSLERLVAKQISDGTWKESYTYAADGSLAQTTITDKATGAVQKIVRYQYDSLGRLLLTEDCAADGTVLSRREVQYNAKGQTAKEAYYDGSITRQNAYTYDNGGKLTSLAMPNGVTTSYTYDYLNRLSAKRYGPGGGRICDYYYYQAYENLMSPLVSDISYHQGNQGDRVTSFKYRYDNVGNIERAEQSDSVRGTIAKSTYRYDRFNQLIQEERDGKTWFYQYDTVGNLLWVRNYDYTGYADYNEAASAASYQPELLLGTDTYTYGNSEWQDLLTAFNGRSITYDAIGNPLTYYNGTDYTMTWEQGRRLSALHTGGKTVSYRYDSEGKRTGKTVGTGQTEYIYAGGQLVSILGTNPDYRIDLIYDESGVQSCIYTAGTAAPVTYYLIKNAQGDVMQLRDEADTIVANYAYDAFGRLLSVTDIDGKAISDQTSFAHRNPLRYRGYLYDSETGFYYLSSRYYDPKIRRFINADAYVSTGQGVSGYNMFVYCGNNPVNNADATGCFWSEAWEFIQTAASEIGKAIGALSPAYAGCGGAALADGPLPFGDILAAAGATLLTVGAIAVGISHTAKAPTKAKAKAKAEEKDITEPLPRDGTTYYHVTTIDNALEIKSSGIMIGSKWESGYVYAWKMLPSKYAIENSGAHMGVTISFKTSASFVMDTGITDPRVKMCGPVVSTMPGPIVVWDVEIVG